MRRIILIRHAKTQGNLEKRYIGQKSDEDILVSEVEQIGQLSRMFSDYLAGDISFYLSPMKRCQETYEALVEANVRTFGGRKVQILEELTEIDFGDFEGHNYKELSGNKDYQEWIDSNGKLPFKNGESQESFIDRSYKAFKTILEDEADTQIVVCHGGNIMAIMMRLTAMSYYDFQINNLEGYCINFEYDGEKIDDLSYCSLSDWLHS